MFSTHLKRDDYVSTQPASGLRAQIPSPLMRAHCVLLGDYEHNPTPLQRRDCVYTQKPKCWDRIAVARGALLFGLILKSAHFRTHACGNVWAHPERIHNNPEWL